MREEKRRELEAVDVELQKVRRKIGLEEKKRDETKRRCSNGRRGDVMMLEKTRS